MLRRRKPMSAERRARRSKQDEPSPLLRLPAELRNKIYELVLIEDEDILVTPALKVPPLVRTCYQIYREAMLYWTGQNTFVVDVVDCDSMLLLKYVKFHCKCRYKNQLEKETGPLISRAGSIHWTNLQGWAKAIWSSDLGALQRSASDDKEQIIIAGALEIAEQHRGRPWEDCQEALDTLRKTIQGLSNVQIL